MDKCILLATNNPAKAAELRMLFTDIPARIVTPLEMGITLDVSECTTSFAENARLKAQFAAKQSGLASIADDSGLEITALGGKPGVNSARYPGEGDKGRVNTVLHQLKDVPWEGRGARFVCVLALAVPQGLVALCHGECRGLITFEPQGENGFGYDPIFYLPEVGKTLAEIPTEVKNYYSHRGMAARRMLAILKNFTF